MSNRVNRKWRLAARPVGLMKPSDFEWREEAAPAPGDGQVLVRNIYLSLDPASRAWVSEGETYLPPVPLGEVMRGVAVGVVEESRSEGFREGDLVQGMLGWQDYAVTDGQSLARLSRDPAIPLTAYLGLLGHIGVTAYFGLLEVGQPRSGETLVVTGAAGAVGSLVGQIGKIKGCRVVGIAGSDQKCRWITEDLGFDAAVNYKTDPLGERLREHCPNGIDVDFENVGGKALDAILKLINMRARIVICGLISQYNATRPPRGPYNFQNVLMKRARVEGFIVLDYMDRANEAETALAGWFKEGKINYRVDVIDGLENAATGVNKLFDGTNTGKLVVKVSDEP